MAWRLAATPDPNRQGVVQPALVVPAVCPQPSPSQKFKSACHVSAAVARPLSLLHITVASASSPILLLAHTSIVFVFRRCISPSNGTVFCPLRAAKPRFVLARCNLQ